MLWIRIAAAVGFLAVAFGVRGDRLGRRALARRDLPLLGLPVRHGAHLRDEARRDHTARRLVPARGVDRDARAPLNDSVPLANQTLPVMNASIDDFEAQRLMRPLRSFGRHPSIGRHLVTAV